MWQRFTERSRRVILQAQIEASQRHSSHVNTEHFLLALIHEEDAVAASLIKKAGVPLDVVRQEVEFAIQAAAERKETLAQQPQPWWKRLLMVKPASWSSESSSEAKLTPSSKQLLELAADEARYFKHNYIGTEHLLLALLRQDKTIAMQVLEKLELKIGPLRQQTLQIVDSNASRPTSNTPQPQKDNLSVGVHFPFTERMNLVINLARTAAQTSSSRHIGTEHLLLGLLQEKESLAGQFLSQKSVSLTRVQAAIEAEAKTTATTSNKEPILTPGTERSLLRAAGEAGRLNNSHIGPEHLLLALLNEQAGTAETILRRLGVDVKAAHEELWNQLAPAPPSS